MIRSGLVNQRLGGGFERGYPTDRSRHPRNAMERPAVFASDSTILTPSQYSDPVQYKSVTPSPIFYNDLFGKKLTPDERLYLLRQAQQGTDRIQKQFDKNVPKLEAAPVKNVNGFPVQPAVDGVDGEELLEEEETAVDVVDPPPRQESAAEIDRATNEWVSRGVLRDAAAGTLGFIVGDVPGAIGAITAAETIDYYWNGGDVNQIIKSNGTGPRQRDIAPAA